MGKLLKVLLAGLLAIGNANLVSAEELPAETEETLLEMHEVDPETLHVPKIGETDEEPEPEEAAFTYRITDKVRVSIVLSEASTMDAGYSLENVAQNQAAVDYRNNLRARQERVTEAINSVLAEPIDVKWNITLTANIISAYVKYGDIEKIRTVAGVEDVFLENSYEAYVEDINTSNSSNYMVGASDAWADGYTGAGSRIAIIDTGIDTSHQSFNADAFNYSIDELRSSGKTVNLMTSSDVSAVKSQLNGKSGTYRTTKIPFGYNYVDESSTITHLNDTQGEHGSHVAGIAAANKYIKSGNSYVEAASSVKAVGMAPDAQLLVMKVFGSSGGAYDSDYMVAIEDAIVLGCDTVNLSLGSQTPGFTYSGSYQTIMNKLSSSSNLKMVTTISAGNSGAFTDELTTDLYADDIYMHTGGEPGTFINSLGTASADNTWSTGTPMTFNSNQTVFYVETDSSGAAMTSVAGTYDYVYIDAVGNTSDYSTVNSSVSLRNKIVIVNRGELSFYEKGNNLKSYSPKGLIVANNVDGGAISMALDSYTGTFPMVSITLADALKIKNNSEKHTAGSYTYYTGTVTVSSQLETGKNKEREDAEISSFSSWGVPGSLLMKPEIAAPGGNIYSVFGTNKTTSGTAGGSDQYELMSGTSMAAPHMAGLGAVLAQKIRETGMSVSGYTTRALNQSLLMSTATPMINDGEYVSILRQGAGLVDVSRAVRSHSVIMMDENDGTLTALTGAAKDGKVKAEIGDNPSREDPYTFSFTIYNLYDEEMEYDLDTDLFTQNLYTEGDDVFMSPLTTQDIIGNWTVSYAWEGMSSVPYDVNMDGQTNDADVNAILEYTAKKAAGESFSIDEAAADVDEDTKITTNDAYALIQWLNVSHQVETGLVIPAGGSKKVTVTINPDQSLEQYHSGAYVEGYTYVRSAKTTNEGEVIEDEHSIPILGFYGSWTDPSMFDNTSYTDTLYGTEKVPYSGKTATNYVTLTSSNTKVAGNPYMTEESFPAERLAVKSSTAIYRVYYNLIRSAGTTAAAASRIDGIGGNVTEVLYTGTVSNNVTGQYYYESSSTSEWKNTSTGNVSINRTPSALGLSEGDTFRIGFYAVPEYNGLIANSANPTAASAGKLTSTTFKNVLLSNVLGKGALIGYDFTVDNTAPVIEEVASSGNSIRVKASDNINLAYISIRSSSGTVYAQTAPGTKEFNGYLTASNIPSTAIVFAADYAGNETSVSVSKTSSVYNPKTEDTELPAITAEAEEVIVDEEVIEEDIMSEEPEVSDQPESAGSLNSIRNYTPANELKETVTVTDTGSSTEETGSTVTVSLYDNTNTITYNGLYKVTYDSALLEYKKTESDASYQYIYETDGAVYIAFASVGGFTAEEPFADITFAKPEAYTEITVDTIESNTQTEIEDEQEIIPVGEASNIFINSASVALDEKIQARIYVYVPDTELETTYITTTFNGTTKTELARDMATAVRSGRECRLVTVDTFAKQMRDDIVVKVHEEDGTPKYLEYKGTDVTDGFTFHVADYVTLAEDNSTDELLIDLVHKMNWYGLYAQKQFNYNPVDFEEPAEITNFNDSVLSSYEVKNTGTANGIEYTSGSLQLDSDTGVRVYYTLTGTDSISDYTFTVDDTEVQPVLRSGKKYYVTISGMAAKELDTVHTITVTDKAGNELTTKYSGLSYAYAVVSNANAPKTLKDLCRSIYLYWEAAYKYFNQTTENK